MPKTPKQRFTVFHLPGYLPQLRDAKQSTKGFPNAGIISIFPTLGGQWSTSQTPAEALRTARKVAKLLNALHDKLGR